MLRNVSLLFLIAAVPLLANDVIYLNGHVRLADGSAPGHSVEIQLSCAGADHAIRQTMSDKKGAFNLKVERDEFNHVARALPATAMDVSEQPNAAACRVIGELKGYTSSAVDLATFTIGKDLKLPEIMLTPKAPR